MTSKTVHFTIEADFIHGHARDLWKEGEYKKTREFLSTMIGVTDKQMNDVIIGKKKFVEYEDTQTFSLVKDNWKPNLAHCHLSQYPDPLSDIEMGKAEEKLDEWRFENEKSVLITRMVNRAEDDRQELQKIKNILLRFDSSGDKVTFFTDCQSYLSGKYMDDTDRQTLEIDKFMRGQEFNSFLENSDAMPKPEEAIYENGIITPDGKFYRCEFGGHNILAEKLGYVGEPPLEPDNVAVKDGCIVLSANLVLRKARYVKELKNEKQHTKFMQWFNLTFRSEIPFLHTEY